MSDAQGPAEATIDVPRDARGEPVFQEPWEARAFAMVTALHDAGRFTWQAFQRRLVEEIDAWERSHPDSDGRDYSYYRHWLRALERTLDEDGHCSLDGIDERVDALGRETPGHDHIANREPIARG